ncbi:MAG: pyruvate:ferredoxin (flavodoxin) oxidoreductase [bacterium]|nr:pyruvate:ferredoxin (flavodoxin) oxidoreductase [bacterium]
MTRKMVTIDGNEAAGYVAHKINEVCAIYPITPSSAMGEWADEFSAKGFKNIWGTVPSVVEMQSEGGAAGAVHGALQSGSLTTTFTASQGLLLMIPNMYKIAGELTATVFHVSARTLATHALSIFGDHSDVMSVRSTGWALWAANSVQEIMDFALITQAATLEARVPIVHFFDGFRTSHEVQKVEQLTEDDMRAMIDDNLVIAHRERALSPDKPVIRGTAQNPDVFFQAREACNPYYDKAPEIFQKTMDKFAKLTGRQYHLFDYEGDANAERVIIIMGSGADTVHETMEHLNAKGEKVGLLKVHVYRPFSIKDFVAALPAAVKTVTTLDRTKEPGAIGEPLYLDVVSALTEQNRSIKVLGGRYGLSSKEFTPAMVKAIYENMNLGEVKNHFTIGINDDVTHTSLVYDKKFMIEPDNVIRCMFWGLGSDGTVGANKNSIKIIGEGTDNFVQGYFVYDSKKAGAVTVSHLRFGPKAIQSIYLIDSANFVACHQPVFLDCYDMLEAAKEGATFLLNSKHSAKDVWEKLPRIHQEHIVNKKIKFYVIDAYKVAKETGMGARINTIMQTCFFAISGVLEREEAIAKIKEAIRKTYGKKGEEIVQMNFEAVDKTLANLHQVEVPQIVTSTIELPAPVTDDAPEYVKNVLGKIISYKGDELPVSAFPADGTFPTATSKYEKRNLALEVPAWETDICIQCAKCTIVCPHAAIRAKIYDTEHLEGAPSTFKHVEAKGGKDIKGKCFTIQVAAEDCTGCGVCVEACPAKDKVDPKRKAINMTDQAPLRLPERENYSFFLKVPTIARGVLKVDTVKGSQMLDPLFEFSGACSGCGETPYVTLMTQLFGERALIANATGCSSIYGGNLPTTPYAVNAEGKGPTWSNSLFEDCAEFGLGFRLTADKHMEQAKELVVKLKDQVGADLVENIVTAVQVTDEDISEQWKRVGLLRDKLKGMGDSSEVKHLTSLTNYLVKKSVWILGGDGWAYDIGYGGLDHVLASGRNVNVLVLDTGVYSNTGGQCSKATPMGAVAKFAASGRPSMRKDLGLMAMSYGNVYVAQVAMGANDNQVVKAFVEAEQYEGPSLIIAYSHCIAHGITMRKGLSHQKAAVESGFWPLYRFNPMLKDEGKNPFKLESKTPTLAYKEWALSETRFKMLMKSNPEVAERLLNKASEENLFRWGFYEKIASMYEPKKA